MLGPSRWCREATALGRQACVGASALARSCSGRDGADRRSRRRGARPRPRRRNRSARPTTGSPTLADDAATSAPVMPVPSAVPSESVSDSADDARPCSAPGASAARSAPAASRQDPSPGRPGPASGSPATVRTGATGRRRTSRGRRRGPAMPARTNRSGPVARREAAWIHEPVVQVRVAAVRAMPGCHRAEGRATRPGPGRCTRRRRRRRR